MTTALIVVLTVVALYLGKRWFNAMSEVAELRTQVATLKRRLTRIGR